MVSQNNINNTIPDNNFSVNRQNAGTTVQSSINHLDNTNSSSHAKQKISVAGTSSGDPFVNLNISTTQDYSFGIDNSDLDNLKITNGTTPSSGTTFFKMSTAGALNLPKQPAFRAQGLNQPNVTGAGTVYTVLFNTSKQFDQTSSFDNISTFTAPQSGIYRFDTSVILGNLAAVNTRGQLVLVTTPVSIRFVETNVGVMRTPSNDTTIRGTSLVKLTVGDTAFIQIQVFGGAADTVGVATGSNTNFFEGYLVV